MWPNLQFPMDLITFTEEISNGKLQNNAFATKKKKKLSELASFISPCTKKILSKIASFCPKIKLE